MDPSKPCLVHLCRAEPLPGCLGTDTCKKATVSTLRFLTGEKGWQSVTQGRVVHALREAQVRCLGRKLR